MERYNLLSLHVDPKPVDTYTTLSNTHPHHTQSPQTQIPFFSLVNLGQYGWPRVHVCARDLHQTGLLYIRLEKLMGTLNQSFLQLGVPQISQTSATFTCWGLNRYAFLNVATLLAAYHTALVQPDRVRGFLAVLYFQWLALLRYLFTVFYFLLEEQFVNAFK